LKRFRCDQHILKPYILVEKLAEDKITYWHDFDLVFVPSH